MKLKLAQTAFALYIKGTRFICYFVKSEDAMQYAHAMYPTEEAHVEPIHLLEEDKT